MTWIPLAISSIITLVFTLVIGIPLHNWDVDRLQKKADADKAAQVQFDIKQCETEKEITSNASKKYEDLYNAAVDDIARLRGAAPTIVYVTKPAHSANAAPGKAICSDANAINSDPLIALAGTCERYRAQVIGLQDFITETWKAKGQNAGQTP